MVFYVVLWRLYIGFISASPTARPLRGYARAGTQNDRLVFFNFTLFSPLFLLHCFAAAFARHGYETRMPCSGQLRSIAFLRPRPTLFCFFCFRYQAALNVWIRCPGARLAEALTILATTRHTVFFGSISEHADGEGRGPVSIRRCPKDSSCQDLSDAALRSDLAPRRSPSACAEIVVKSK